MRSFQPTGRQACPFAGGQTRSHCKYIQTGAFKKVILNISFNGFQMILSIWKSFKTFTNVAQSYR